MIGEFGGDGLELDLVEHRYTYDGKRVPGVTEILTGVGLVDRRWFSEYARERGTAVHSAVELLVRGQLDWASVDTRIVGYVKAAENFLSDAGFEFDALTLVEHPVYHEQFKYAGTLDLFARVFKKHAVVDWKTGGSEGAGPATAGYRGALGHNQGCFRMAVQLRNDGTYRKTDLNDPFDWPHFQMAAEIYNRYHLPRAGKEKKTDE